MRPYKNPFHIYTKVLIFKCQNHFGSSERKIQDCIWTMCGHTGKDMETTCFDRWQDWILSLSLVCGILVWTSLYHVCWQWTRQTCIYIKILDSINHSGIRNVCFDLCWVAFKLKIVQIFPSANNSITQWHFHVEGTGDKGQKGGGVTE